MDILSIVNKAVPILRDDPPAAGTGGVNTILGNVKTALGKWGETLMMIAGIAMIIIGTFKIAQGLMSHGKTQVSWPVNIMLIVIGVVFCIGSAWNKLTTGNIGNLITNELDGLAA